MAGNESCGEGGSRRLFPAWGLCSVSLIWRQAEGWEVPSVLRVPEVIDLGRQGEPRQGIHRLFPSEQKVLPPWQNWWGAFPSLARAPPHP